MEENILNLWWGYKHKSGTYQVKRYFSQQDIDEAIESPFCEKVSLGPFMAKNREDALVQLKYIIDPPLKGSDEYIEYLNNYQKNSYTHPLTCCSFNGCNRLEQTNEGVLIATKEGWICPCGKYTQKY